MLRDMMEENDNMEFLKDIEAYNESMDNAYLIITRRKTVDDIYYELERGETSKFYLPFDPLNDDGRNPDVLDLVIEYFESREEYEKCAELSHIKTKCLKKQIE